MFKKVAIFIVIVIAMTLAAGIIYSLIQPREYSWAPTYSSYGKQPYDTYVFYEQLNNFFPAKTIRKLHDKDLRYYYRNELYDIDSIVNDELVVFVDSTAFLIDLNEEKPPVFNFVGLEQFFYTDNLDAKALLLHIYQGNHALIASEEISELFLKMVEVKMEFADWIDDENPDDEAIKRFTIQYTNHEPIPFKVYASFSHIISYPDHAKVMAKNMLGEVVGISLPIGKGTLTIFSAPIIFTNYYLLKENNSLIADMLLELPVRPTYWAGSIEGVRAYPEKRSIMDYIHSQKALSWAFYTLIIGTLLFLALQLRRVERAIPLIEKPKNISLSFIESVSALFFLHKDNRELVRKKMNFFLDRVRTQYHLDTQEINERFILLLAKKLQVKASLLNHIFNLYNEYTHKPVVTNEEFLRFNKLMQTFKHKI